MSSGLRAIGRNPHALTTSHGHRSHYTFRVLFLNALDSAYDFSFHLAVPVADLQALHMLGKRSTISFHPQSLCIKAFFKKLLEMEQ